MLKQSRSGSHCGPPRRPRLALAVPLAVLIILLALPSLACSFSGLLGLPSARYPKGVQALLPTRTPWPTFTPMATPTPRLAPATETPVPPVEAAPAEIPAPVLTPTAAAPIVAATPVEVAAPSAAPVDAVLPAETATPQVVAVAPAPVGEASVAPPTDAATPTAPLPSPTAAPASAGWSFSGVANLAGESEEGLLLVGELVNGTGAPQQAIAISGAFYDAQGEVAVDTLDVVSYVPVDPVPADAHVPFQLLVSGSPGIDRFDLRALSEPARDTLRQDFQFSGVEQWVDDQIGYCMRGQVENQGRRLREYLVVLAIVYDDQGSVVSFGEYYPEIPPGSGAQSSTFELCLGPFDRQISRYDLRAFGY